MSVEQKGVLIAVDRDTWQQVEYGFIVKKQFPKHLPVSDIDYLYAAEKTPNGGYHAGHIGQIRKFTIETAPDKRSKIYTFELSKVLKPSIATGQLQFEVRDRNDGDIIDWDFETVIEEAKESKYASDLLENPAKSSLPPLSLKEAVQRLADTYGIAPEKVTISITG